MVKTVASPICSGCNVKSMEVDGLKVLGIFNFHLTAGCAVDEQLYSYIINHSSDHTAHIYRRIALMVTDEWMDDAMFYYRAVHDNQVRMIRGDARVVETNQTTVDAHVVPLNETPAHKKQRTLKGDLTRLD